jgi:hypothetical protein
MYDESTEDDVMEGLAQGDTRLTYDDFLLFPDDGKRHEIIDGVHYVTASPNLRHQVLIGRLHFEIESWLRQHPGAGQVFLSPLDVLFTRWDIVEPDLLFVASDQADIMTEQNIQGRLPSSSRSCREERASGTKGSSRNSSRAAAFGSTGWSIPSAIASKCGAARGRDRSTALPTCRANSTTCLPHCCCPGWRFHWRSCFHKRARSG